jgi:hypothetical protein
VIREKPYKISGLGLRPAKPPVAESRKLSEKDVKKECSQRL